MASHDSQSTTDLLTSGELSKVARERDLENRRQSIPVDAAGASTFADLRAARELASTSGEEAKELSSDPFAGMSRKEKRAAKKQMFELKGVLRDYPHLLAMKPREGYLFRSDYYLADKKFVTILAFFHQDGAVDNYPPFWGVSRIPTDLRQGVSVTLLDQVAKMSKRWIDAKQKSFEQADNLAQKEDKGGATSTQVRQRTQKMSADNEVISRELQNGAAYLHVHNRMMVRADTLDDLDATVREIQRDYTRSLGTLTVAPYIAEQRRELSTIMAPNDKKRGSGFHFTSTEYAGSYSLVTNGLNDPDGENVGGMTGDVNTSAIVFNVNGFDKRVVIADDTINRQMEAKPYFSDMWGSKISQAALVNGNRAVHVILNEVDMDQLGPRFDRFTARLDMNRGDINMLEMFGTKAEELVIFPAHLDKLVLMTAQASGWTGEALIDARGALREELIKFYIDRGMWYANAKENRKALRVVGIPHEDVPRLQDLVSYFDSGYKKAQVGNDPRMIDTYRRLASLFKDMLDSSGDLFNTTTSGEIDGVSQARRVLYNFSQLLRRGEGLAMAQLVNVIGFAVSSLTEGDVLIIHGAEDIASDEVRDYLESQFKHLQRRGGRVVLIYNSVEKMLKDQKFNIFDAADYTILGPMREPVVAEYQELMKKALPRDLAQELTTKSSGKAYLQRGHTNVLFYPDLALGLNKKREKRRRELVGENTGPTFEETLIGRLEQERMAKRAEKERKARASAVPAEVPRMRRKVERRTLR